ncbi:MAG TPA: hypothetical protein VD973_09485 [Symbiobacteriaceae bacterium]|nr:hypothetical protein [Symbiobacteriaceae bacterium]
MVQLHVTVGREIQFISSPDLPADFRRAIARDNTFPNPLHQKKPAFPPTVEAYYHNPITREVVLPRGYWPQMLAQAEECGVDLVATVLMEEGEQPPAVITRYAAVSLQDLPLGLSVLHDLVAGSIPADWGVVNLQLTVTRHKPLSPEAQGDQARPPVQLEYKPFPWEAEPHG